MQTRVSCSGRHVVGQGNVTIVQHLQSNRRSGDLILNLQIQLYLYNATNLHQISSHSTTSCPTTWISYR